MIRTSTTPEERREVLLHWERMRLLAEKIREAYDRGEEMRVRRRVGGKRSYTDSVVLYFGPPPS